MQSSSLSTYIGYITGPRADQPVGVRVVEPAPSTRQHQRGSLYAVVEVVGEHPDRGAIVERLLSEVHRVYYSAKGSQSQVMVEAVQQTQQLLREIVAHTPHYPMQLGITCAALLGSKLLVASSGPAFALMRVSERVHMFPSEPNMTAGGYGNVPIEVYRQDVSSGDALFLGGGGWLRRVPTRTLASIIAFTNADNCADAADELFDQAGQMQVPGLLIVLGSGANSEPPRPSGYGGYGGGSGYPSAPGGGGPSGGGARPPAPRRPRFGGLPTALNSAPPARMPPTPPSSTFQPLFPETPSSSQPISASSPTAFTETQPRSSPLERREPPGTASQASVPLEELPPTSAMPVDAPRVETPAEKAQRFESPAHEPPAYVTAQSETAPSETDQEFTDRSTIDIAGTHALESPRSQSALEAPRSQSALEAPNAKSRVAEEANYPYPVSPLEEDSFGGDLPVEPGEEFDPIFPPPAAHERVEKSPQQPSWLAQWQEQAGERMQQARGFLGRMLPERRAAESATEWEEISDVLENSPQARPRFNELEAQLEAAPTRQRRVRQAPPVDKKVDAEDEESAEAVGPPPVLEVSPFEPPAPTRGARARLFLLIALVIVILVPVVVAAVNIGKGNNNRAEAEKLTARAEIVLLGAQSALDQGDKVTARERLTEAQDYLAQAIALDGSNETRERLIVTIEAELQEVLQVIPLYGLTEPLITFPPDARPRHVLVMNEDIFVIDEGRQALLQYRFDPASGTVADQNGQVILSQGDQVGGASVGTLADIAWLPLIPGFEDRPSLIITDRNNNVFRYDQRVEGATVMPFADRGEWGSIGQVQTYNGRIYIADEARGSILRYEPGRFDAAGEPWFSPETQVNLSGLTSLEIDGDIWLLFSNGMILRYRERQQLPFSPENSIGLAEEPTDMYVTRQDSAYVYVVDAGQDRILVYEKSGAYVGQLRAPEGDLMRGLSAIHIDEVGGMMYILTQSGLFAHPVLP